MKRSRSHFRFRSDLAFLDMLFNMALAFAFLFIIAILLIRPVAPPVDVNTKLKAEYLLTMEWSTKTLDDVDLWLMLPSGAKVHYMNKDVEHATLDRDDRGGHGDTIWKDQNKDQKILIKRNEEVITLRAVVPGRYVATGHLFSEYSEIDGIKSELSVPYVVTLKLTKLNPRVELIAETKITLEKLGQEIAFIAFVIQADGKVTDIEINPRDMLVQRTYLE